MAAACQPEVPQVSVIIPARNEESTLPACLESLTAQSGVTWEIIVVDDASSDRTRAVAESYSAVRVLDSGALPVGWTGKCNALMTGGKAARGEWLLLTDADTQHRPGSLAAALEEARRRKVELLSYSPAQVVRGFWQRAVMPVIYAELASKYQPKAVSDPKSKQAAANGQYILVRRDAYLAVGGHGRVAQSLLDDVALAWLFKTGARPIFFRYGGDRVRTRMYQTFAEMRDGWTKNLALLFPATVELAALRMAELLLLLACAAIALAEVVRGGLGQAASAAVLGALVGVLFWNRIRKAHFGWECEVLAPAGLPVFAWLLLRSRRAYQQGKVTWKGRVYGAPSPAAGGLVQISVGETATQTTAR